MKSYMLIRVSLDVGRDEWFGEKLGKARLPEIQGISGEAEREEIVRGRLFGRIRERYRRKKRLRCQEALRIARERELERLEAERQERIHRTEESVRRLALTVREYAGEESRCFGVYEDSLRSVLTSAGEEQEGIAEGREVLPFLWRRCFELTEFGDYCGRFWTELLLPCARLPHFVILGTASVLYEVLGNYASGMKSLKWILPEAECGEELLEFVEEFYTEYGLAISLQTLPDVEALRGIRKICVQPSNIIDFTEEPRVVPAGAAEGSIWVDMRSVEEKRRRIERRSAGITYVSLKEKWKYAQRRCNPPGLP